MMEAESDKRQLDQQLLPTPSESTSSVGSSVQSFTGSSTVVSSGEQPFQGSILSRYLFGWVFPLLRRAVSVEKLDPADLFALAPPAEPTALYDAFMAQWHISQARGPRRQGRWLLVVLARVHLPGIWHLWLGRLVQTLLSFTFPLFLNLITKFVTNEDASVGEGIALAFCFLVLGLLAVVIDNNVACGMQSFGLRIKASLIVAVFRKVITLRQDSMLSFSTGKLNNLITTDVDKAQRLVRYIHIVIMAPIQVTIAMVSLYKLMGASIFIGFSWLLVVLLVNPVLMLIMGKLEDKQQSATDERVRKATEAISGIQVIKCHAWEEASTAKVEDARKAELLAMWRLYALYTVFESIWGSIVPISTAAMFASYALLNPDKPLTAAQAFTAISLLGMVNGPLFIIPWVLNLIVEALVAATRLERLFSLPEVCLPSTAAIPSFVAAGGVGLRQRTAPADALSQRLAADTFGPAPTAPRDAVEFHGESFAWPRVKKQDEDDSNEAAEGTAGGESSSSNAGDGGTGEGSAASEGAAQEDSAATPVRSGDSSAQPSSEQTTAEAESGETNSFVLSDLCLRVPHGALVAVVGATASGKTSLLQAILGEMPPLRSSSEILGEQEAVSSAFDSVSRDRPIAFAPQQSWIFNASVKENILFGEAFSERRYSECIRCCDLEKDLSSLKFGSETKVGEKGIALSGGQKARVCLARAAYRQGISNIFLLDDPYSALDAHVAATVHAEVVTKHLAKKTRVVVTNRLEFVSGCDLVVVMEAGRIEAVGSFDEVRTTSPTLRTLLAAQGLDIDGSEEGKDNAKDKKLDRTISYKSVDSQDDEVEEDEDGQSGVAGGDEEEEEERATGQVKKEVLFYYFSRMGGYCTVSFLASMYLFSELLNLASPIWISVWVAKAPGPDEFPFFLGIYVALSVIGVVFTSARDMTGNVISFRAARRLHREMFASLLRAPMTFFQDTPQGRITNRFSKDISEIDKDLCWTMIYTFVPILSLLGNLALVGGIAYFALLAFVPAIGLYYKCWKYYSKTAMDLKRISKVTSSPLYDHFNNLCRESAISIVRAHQQVQKQCKVNNDLVTEQQRPEYSIMYTELWFCMCVESLGSALVFFVTVFVVLGRGVFISASSAGLVLSVAGECSGSIQALIGQIAEFGMAFNCVERVMEYAKDLPSEAPLITDVKPEASWPSTGVLEVKDLRMRYRPELDLVLKGISFSTKSGEHLGVVGRTGAGKSSLLLAILRIVEPEQGSLVRLDGQDLTVLGLRDVRKNIAMIPQEPVLFQETLRYNCDPFAQSTASDIWAAMEEVQLSPWIREQNASAAGSSATSNSSAAAAAASATEDVEELLRLQIAENGQNLSAGQRQMVAIARAVLRQSRLVVLDEATAAIDAATDAAIQSAVRRCFEGATTLTIAHRLQTILDSDRVMVLSAGEIAEIGPPDELRAMDGGIFRSMVEESGN